MARKGLIETNERRKRKATFSKSRRDELKKNIMNRDIPIEERFSYVMKLSKMPRDGSRTRIRSRCMVTGRPRAVYKFFGLSRIAFRDLAINGKLPGVIRSSW